MLRGIFDNEWFCVKFCPSTLEGSLNKQHNPYFLFLLSYGPTLNWRLNGDKRTFLDDLMGRNGLFLHETYNRAIHIFSNEIFTSFVFYFGRWKNHSLISFVEIWITTYIFSYSVCWKVCLYNKTRKFKRVSTQNIFKAFNWWTITQYISFRQGTPKSSIRSRTEKKSKWQWDQWKL